MKALSPARIIAALELFIRWAAGSTGDEVRTVRFCEGGRDLALRVPADSVWTAVKDDLLLREYEWLGVEFADLTGLVVDVGAHVGTFAARVAGHVPGVVAIEPHPVMAGLLRDNIAANGLTNVEIVELGLWETAGYRHLYERDGSTGSTLTDGESEDGLLVQTTTLDEIVRRHGPIDLLKLDIEGAEWGAIGAASDDTLRSVRAVVGELHYWATGSGDLERLLDRFRGLGFDVRLQPGPVYRPWASVRRAWRFRKDLKGHLRLKLTLTAVYLLVGLVSPAVDIRRRFSGEELGFLLAVRRP